MLIIIDNYDSFTYNLYQMAADLLKEVSVFRNDALTVDELERLNPSGLILSPGPKAPDEAGICIRAIQKLAPKIPILGVCLGMQAIGAAYGARIVRASQPKHGQSSSIYHTQTGIYQDLPSPFLAGRYHSLIVEESSLPSILVKEAETEEGVIMGIRHCDYPCYGVQFHPESILTPQGNRLIQNFIEVFLYKEFL